MSRRYQAVLFDLLTALLDSWTVWDRAAGSSERGRAWRAEYLRLTYGCGAYRPYEVLVTEAARATGMDEGAPARLEEAWETLTPWSGVTETLSQLKATHRLGVVTNCSERLGQIAAARVGVPFDVIVTSERAGFYKPDLRPYQLALADLGLPASTVLFVAGSGYDLFGTAACGLDTYWHNRIGLAAPEGAPAPLMLAVDLAGLPALASRA
jgi:2-haloalkanoic acid dehalogenase type II